jgi:hypothetical protein
MAGKAAAEAVTAAGAVTGAEEVEAVIGEAGAPENLLPGLVE